MATITHYIYSHYEPPRDEEEEEEIDQEHSEEDNLDPWLTEATFGADRHVKRAPRFVPAIVSYDEINNMMGSISSAMPHAEEPLPSTQVGDWYRSLPRSSSVPVSSSQVFPLSQSLSQSSDPGPVQKPQPPRSSRRTNDWFATPKHSSRSTSTPTLADILSRDPPPKHKQQPFVPPVFLHIGPSNKGFTMLQQNGWSEGEALGASAPRRTSTQKARKMRPARTFLDDKEMAIRTEVREVAVDEEWEVRELRKVDVIDLTLSDSDEDAADDATVSGEPSETSPTSHNPTALLTPIATVLKSDRLGIGLKAKTVGPYKESKKRVTHNQAALAAHVRVSEEMRIRKALQGRGEKSFARIAKADAVSRRKLLASLNAD